MMNNLNQTNQGAKGFFNQRVSDKPFDSKDSNVRLGFIRKVYVILSL